jgi:hypothetical protein
MKSMSGGSYSPIPKAMMEMLARMRLEEETPHPTLLPPKVKQQQR